MNPAVNPYQQTQVGTASPEQLLIMLYDGAIRFIAQAEEAVAAGERLKKLEGVSRALAIVTYLADTLDHQAGWEMSENLDGLYGYMARELSRANLENDQEGLKGVGAMLADLRQTWLEAIELAKQDKSTTLLEAR